MRFLISDNQINPIAWEVSKVEDTFPPGVIYITLKQDQFNPKTDNKELMIADYYKSPVTPAETPTDAHIQYTGNAEIKVGGSYKSFSVTDMDGDFSWNIKGIPEDKYESIISDTNDQIKIKVTKDYELIGSTITLSLLDNKGDTISSVDIGVISL